MQDKSRVTPEQRWSEVQPCPVCGGHEGLPRGQGKRCHGFPSGDGSTAYCSREEHAGEVEAEPGCGLFPHRVEGPCGCGADHAEGAHPGPIAAGAGPGRRSRRGRCVCTYEHYDEFDNLLFWIDRQGDSKGFAAGRPDPADPSWSIRDLTGARGVPFNLPGVLRAVRADETICVVDGEKDVAAIHGPGGGRNVQPVRRRKVEGRALEGPRGRRRGNRARRRR
jgi:hypothetical protein